MGKRIERLSESIERARLIDPAAARLYQPAMAYFRRMAEQLAPEVFKWIGWSVAIAAIRIVALNVRLPWLSALPYVLLWVVMLRIAWFIGPVELKESARDDGSVELERPTWRIALRALAALLITWALAYLIVFQLADAIADSDLLRLTNKGK